LGDGERSSPGAAGETRIGQIIKGFVFHIKRLELYIVGKMDSLKGSEETNDLS
jgi:hypothetical protein